MTTTKKTASARDASLADQLESDQGKVLHARARARGYTLRADNDRFVLAHRGNERRLRSLSSVEGILRYTGK